MMSSGNSPTLLARINYQINIYDAGSNMRAIEIKNEWSSEYHFIKGDKIEAGKFLNEIAQICGVGIEVKDGQRQAD